MLRTRVIPVLLLRNESLVKTINFNKYTYIGDPINTVRIFNELEVDELIFLDITATLEKREPNYKLLSEIANECFMPLSYGGGIHKLENAQRIFDIGFEKVSINSSTHTKPTLISEIAKIYGSQAVVASIDIKKSFFGKLSVWTNSGKVNTKQNPQDWALEMQNRGAGEILLTNIDKEGTWSGFEIDIIKKITDTVSIPVIANGGAGSLTDIKNVVKIANASAVALGNMVLFQKKDMGVLINFPNKKDVEDI